MADTPLKPDSLEQFAHLLADDVDPSEAYRKSGVGVTLACTVREAASRPEIKARVAAIRAAPPDEDDDMLSGAPTMETLTENEILAMLAQDRRKAHLTGQAAPATRCTELMAKMKGFLVERSVAVTATVDVPDLELAQRIAYLLTAAEDAATLELRPAPDSVTT